MCEGEGPHGPCVAAPLAAAGCRGNCTDLRIFYDLALFVYGRLLRCWVARCTLFFTRPQWASSCTYLLYLQSFSRKMQIILMLFTDWKEIAACENDVHFSVMSVSDILVSSLNDDLKRATDVMIVGKLASVCGCGKVWFVALRSSGARVSFAESDPFCADTAKIAPPLSVVLVLACCLPNVTPSAPCRRASKVSRLWTLRLCLRHLCFLHG